MAADPSSTPSLRGKLLIATPALRDSSFSRSVVLITEHDAEKGAEGFILNHPSGNVISDVLKGPEFSPLKQVPVHHGGPVLRDQLTFSSFWWSRKLGLRWALRISTDQAVAHAHRPGRIIRAFVGYSGWAVGQLESELLQETWIPLDPPADLLGRDHDALLWPGLLRQISPLHRILAESPQNPLLN